ncbi:hypothetical protein [Novosphingobium sp. MMS21-SN21R]|nr:hypothetical protein [Novosphingobium sp. MMS21-SN21R]MDT0507546.1 hypothetical protein [Novosphingobium sp. MMS21-SN21R]MDT0509519.1 hypothetical protein [Novosphingobium sp. MMS21-SN21R]
MLKSLFRKLARKVVGKSAAEVIADKADRALVKELDRRTGGLASKADEVF